MNLISLQILGQEGASSSATGAVAETADMFAKMWSDMTGSFGSTLGEFVPKLLAALMILIVGFIIAKMVKWAITKVINKTGVGTKIGGILGSTSKSDVGGGFGTGAFWIVMLFVAIACLKALGLDNVSEPLMGLLNQFFEFMPKIIGAAAVGAVAFLVATMAKFGVHKGLSLGDVDNRLKLKQGTLLNSLPIAAFCFVLLFFLPSVFGTLEMEELSGPVTDMVNQIISFLPNLFSAGIILAIFFFIAKLASTLVANLLGGMGFNNVPTHLGLVADTSSMKTQPAELAGKASMGVILLMGVGQAVQNLKLEMLTNFFNEAWEFGIPVVIGVAILAVGLWMANMARKAVQSSSMANSDMVSQVAFTAIMVMTGVIALKKMGLAGQIIDLGFGLTLGGIALALALAFGLGGRDAAAKYLDSKVK